MKVLFVAGFAPIVEDVDASSALYIDGLGLPMEKADYPSTNELGGVKHFGLWPLRQAAQSCFGSDQRCWFLIRTFLTRSRSEAPSRTATEIRTLPASFNRRDSD